MQSYQAWLFSYKAEMYDGREPSSYVEISGKGHVLSFTSVGTAILLDSESGKVHQVPLENLQKLPL
jgi:hypothetical protein